MGDYDDHVRGWFAANRDSEPLAATVWATNRELHIRLDVAADGFVRTINLTDISSVTALHAADDHREDRFDLADQPGFALFAPDAFLDMVRGSVRAVRTVRAEPTPPASSVDEAGFPTDAGPFDTGSARAPHTDSADTVPGRDPDTPAEVPAMPAPADRHVPLLITLLASTVVFIAGAAAYVIPEYTSDFGTTTPPATIALLLVGFLATIITVIGYTRARTRDRRAPLELLVGAAPSGRLRRRGPSSPSA